MTVVKYGSQTLALRKMEEELFDGFQRKCIPIEFREPVRLTVFQTVSSTKNVVLSHFLDYNEINLMTIRVKGGKYDC